MEKVCEGIEEYFGRLKVTAVEYAIFSKNRMIYTEQVRNSKHIDEYQGCTFIELIYEYTKNGWSYTI